MRRMMLDVESIGLYGDGLAYGFVIFDGDVTVEEGLAIAHPDTCAGERKDLDWINTHVFPWIDAMSPEFPKAGERSLVLNDPTTGVLTTLCDGPGSLREAFWSVWEREKARGTELWGDVCYPVEANFLASCVRARTGRKFEGPFPLLDVATVTMVASTQDLRAPLRQCFTGVRSLPRASNELPEHHPLMDARHSVRRLRLGLEELGRA